MSERKKLRVAIVGCGAIAEQGHLPATLQVPEVQVTLLVNRHLPRARQMAAQFQVANAQSNLDGIERQADAAIIATPPGAHAALAVELMQRGLHVLVEKPLANTVQECEQMAAAARRTGRVVAVGMVRRFFWADRFIKGLLGTGAFGNVTSFRAENGYPFEWPSASRFILSKAEAGGGVLIGLGSHVLDTLFWWLGQPGSFEFYSDAQGGLDADCRLELRMQSGASGVVELSRTRQLENRCVIECEYARIEAPFLGNTVEIVTPTNRLRLSGTVKPEATRGAAAADGGQPMVDQLRDFIEAIYLGREPMATLAQVTSSIQLIEACYAAARPWPQPWMQPIVLPEMAQL